MDGCEGRYKSRFMVVGPCRCHGEEREGKKECCTTVQMSREKAGYVTVQVSRGRKTPRSGDWREWDRGEKTEEQDDKDRTEILGAQGRG